MIYLISTTVFLSVIFILVSMLLLVESRLVKKGECKIIINDSDDKSLNISGGVTLLSALINNGILIPSACGGKGSCGTCKCRVDAGGRDVLPTELTHLSRQEKQNNVRLACQVKVKEDMSIRIPESIFGIKKHGATVVSNENVATFIKELVIKLDNDEQLEFEAGSFVQIDIPEYEAAFSNFIVAASYKPSWDRFNLWGLRSKSKEYVYRAYSLANPPAEKDLLKFTVRIATPPPGKDQAPPGVGSSFIFNLKPGDRVLLSGPYGEFHIKETEKEMCYVGGGAGMAPLKSHIFHALETLNTDRKVSFWYGARSKQEIFFDDEFRALEEKHRNFSFHIALSDPQPEDNWTGLTGYIHDCLRKDYLESHDDPTEIEYYLCGPPPMIDAIEDMLDNLGVEPEMIAYDKF
ncbi:MAG: NADH:ubiquinone reductase (Na(+)-transporting) subunit F [Desulfobacterales bacterium]|nr:NADH:ubiquinone reductase (Na(+)-transporting) subunit F [Desulfobacterales bacterium]